MSKLDTHARTGAAAYFAGRSEPGPPTWRFEKPVTGGLPTKIILQVVENGEDGVQRSRAVKYVREDDGNG